MNVDIFPPVAVRQQHMECLDWFRLWQRFVTTIRLPIAPFTAGDADTKSGRLASFQTKVKEGEFIIIGRNFLPQARRIQQNAPKSITYETKGSADLGSPGSFPLVEYKLEDVRKQVVWQRR